MAAVVTKWLSYVMIALLANVFESVRFNACIGGSRGAGGAGGECFVH